MGVDTNGQLAYGIMCEEGQEFPWDAAEWRCDIDNWWVHGIGGFPWPDHYDNEDKLKITREEEQNYYKRKLEHEQQNPIPARLINVCSDDFAVYMLIVPSTFYSTNGGYAQEIKPVDLRVHESRIQAFYLFLQKHLPNLKGQVSKWFLSSHCG